MRASGRIAIQCRTAALQSKTLAAMEEAKQISQNPDIEGYTSMEALKKALEE